MHSKMLKIFLNIFTLQLLGLALSSLQYIEKYKLSDVSLLELSANKVARRRNGPSVPEAKCIGGTVGCYEIYPASFICLNKGFEPNDTTIKWDCEAKYFNDRKFRNYQYHMTNTQVTCEGFDSPTDPYVLIGSCSLDYMVELDPDRLDIEFFIQITLLAVILPFFCMTLLFLLNCLLRQCIRV